MLRTVRSPLTPHAEPAIQEQWKGTLGSARDHGFVCTAALLMLQKPILLSSTTCLVLGLSSFADTTRAATPAKEQQHQLSRSVTSFTLNSIPCTSLWFVGLLSFCECTDGERAHPKEPRKGSWWSPWYWGMGSCLSPATWHCSGLPTLSKQLRGRGCH